MSHGAESVYRTASISRRFSYLLIGIVTILLMVFSTIVVSYQIRVIDTDLNTRLESAISFAQKSMPTPMWNLDYDVVSDVIDALFLNESVVYTTIYLDDRIIIEKSRLERRRTGREIPHTGFRIGVAFPPKGVRHQDNIAIGPQ